jgi:ribosomal protein S27E
MPPNVTDWISSIASLVGGLAGVGALIVSFLSYRKSSRALASEKDTLDSVSATLDAVEALGALDGETRAEGQVATADGTKNTESNDADGTARESFKAALEDAQEKLATARSRIFRITCPHCGTNLGPFSQVSSGLVRCGHCGRPFKVRVERGAAVDG